MSNDEEKKNQVLQLLKNILEQDQALRDQLQVGEKFRFIRDRLKALLTYAETNLLTNEKTEKQSVAEAGADESIVYIYLFNAQGLVLQTWHKMVNRSVFYEYSVNRPIYKDKSHIDAFIRSKPNKVQHGYLSVIINNNDILKSPAADISKDTLGNPLIKIREGSLKFEKFISFSYSGNEYTLNESGGLVKK
jgi:Dot/Icm secretion system protein (dot_icm_IcmQ)